VTKPSDDEMMELFSQHLRFLRERREDAVAQIAASRELIEHSRALIVQIDEQINQIERELVGGRPRSEPSPASQGAATAEGTGADHE
jgi:hypothetical protein